MRVKMLGMTRFYTIGGVNDRTHDASTQFNAEPLAGQGARPEAEPGAPPSDPRAALPDLAALPLGQLLAALISPVNLAGIVTRALTEDFGEAGDVTSEVMIPRGTRARGAVRARSDGVVAGTPIAVEVARQAAPGVRVTVHVQDGERVAADQVILSLDGPLAGMLAAERTLLNFLGRLSGVATTTAAYVAEVAGTRAAICDTRKTTPGMRAFEKYAVRCGGGVPHRIGLFDALLVKDNHVAGLAATEMAARIADAGARARAAWPLRFVMAECDTLEQLDALLALPPGSVDIALLDNMDLDGLRTAVNHRDYAGSAMRLEASGGVALDTVRSIAQTGVDRISVGALTHSAMCLDIGLDVEPGESGEPPTRTA
jgi:nicotinate-nucleotide pyrophosphorylase (carboxylating)